jgi:hypothetical protein
VVPAFGDKRGDKDTDFNDMMIALGIEAVKQAFDNAIAPEEFEDEDDEDDPKKERDKQALVLLKMLPPTTPHGGLFRTRDQVGYADIVVGEHRETMKIRSTSFRRWLVHQFYLKTEGSASGEAVRSAIELVEAKAQFNPEVPVRDIFVRVGEHAGKIYIDLCDDQWRAVEIDSDGWRIVTDAPVRFRRAPAMLPLPEPIHGGSVDKLRPFVNVKSDDDFIMLVAWTLAALRNIGPYAILKIWGESGSAKSTLVEFIRNLIDPHKVVRRRLPKDDRDLAIAANNAHVLSFDNVSHIQQWLSDALCNLSTGGGSATRSLYTDSDETLFDAIRPIVLNGVTNFITQHDFAERTVELELKIIPKKKRRLEKQLKEMFERERPAILGALLQAMAHGLKHLPQTESAASWGRMADFECWVSACEGAFWKPGTFAQAYKANRSKVTTGQIEDDPVAAAITAFMTEEHDEWIGTTGDLLAQLTSNVGEQQAQAKIWPKEPRGLTSCLQNARAALRKVGITIGCQKKRSTSRGRLLILKYGGGSKKVPGQPSVPSVPSVDSKSNGLKTEGRAEDRMRVAPGARSQRAGALADPQSSRSRPSVSNTLKSNKTEGAERTEGRPGTFKERTPTPYPVNRRGREADIMERARRKRNKPGR